MAAKPTPATPAKTEPTKLTPDDPRNRFVEDGEGMTINGIPIAEYPTHPDTLKALKDKNATAKPGE